MYQTRTHQRCSAQAIITPPSLSPSALTFVRVWSARSAVEECVFLLKDQGPNHDEQLSAASKKKTSFFIFLSQAWLFQKRRRCERERTAYHFMPENKNISELFM